MASRRQNRFAKQIEIALNHYHDPKWLGLHSPLAMPSFLGEHLLQFYEKTGVDSILPIERGRILQKMLRESADSLWDGGLPEDVHALESMVNDELNSLPATRSYRLSYLLLELKYFRAYFHENMFPPNVWVDIQAYLGFGGKGPFVNLTKTARRRFAEQLLSDVKPAFRLEQPYQKVPIVGRDTILQQCQIALLEHKSVMLSGNGGVGKTTLGMAIGKAWETPVFWYTFRLGLNDNLSSLLFALGFFFQKHAQSLLWTHLVAQNDHHSDDLSNVDHALALGLLLDDLHRQPTPPLICVDEIDLLEQRGLERISSEHALLIELIEAIRSQRSPLLLIGQKPTISADLFIELSGLKQADVEQLLSRAYFVIEPEQMEQIMAYTQGNPRLVELLLASSQEKRSLSDTLSNLPKLHSVRSLLIRLWKHLSGLERSVVGLLSVFRKPISLQSSTIFSDEDILSNLIKRHLVKQDEVGDLFILETYQTLIYEMLSAEEREEHHTEASQIRHHIGEFSAAAYHAVLAGEYVQAIKLFHPYIELECRRGNATFALNTFQAISINRVSGKDNQHKLLEIRMLLARRLGKADDIIREAPNVPESPERNINDLHNSAIFHSQIAVGHYMNGQFESASDSYQKALDLLADVTHLTIRNIRQMTQIQHQNHGITVTYPALREAEYQFKRLQGFVLSRSGEYDKAEDILHEALSIAEKTNNDANVAFVCRELIIVHNKNNLEKSRQFAERAIDIHRRMGNLLSVSHVQAELGTAYAQQDQYDEAIKLLEESLSSFERFRSVDWLLVVKTSLAHCYLATNQIDEAHTFASAVLREEERRFEPYVRLTLGEIERLNGKIEQAETHFEIGIQVADANGEQGIHASLERAYGRFYCEQGKKREGIEMLFSALSKFSELKQLKECAKTQKVIEHHTHL